jgi:hypothetical protein
LFRKDLFRSLALQALQLLYQRLMAVEQDRIGMPQPVILAFDLRQLFFERAAPVGVPFGRAERRRGVWCVLGIERLEAAMAVCQDEEAADACQREADQKEK